MQHKRRRRCRNDTAHAGWTSATRRALLHRERPRLGALGHRADGEQYVELAAFAWLAGRHRPDAAAVLLHDALHDVEPQAEPAVGAAVRALEGVEDGVELVG